MVRIGLREKVGVEGDQSTECASIETGLFRSVVVHDIFTAVYASDVSQ